MLRLLFLFGLFFSSVSSPWAADDAEYVYRIQVASHADPHYEDFKQLRSIGYLYTEQTPNKMYRILLGLYYSKTAADQKLGQVRAKGFKDAFVLRDEIKESEAVYMVQVATVDQDEPIAWADWQRLGDNLCVQLSESQLRIAYGPYKTQAEAQKKQTELQGKAPRDMFVKKVSPKTLHAVSEFEMSASRVGSKPVARRTVKLLQQFLAADGTYKGTVDGFWGNETQTAANAFKKNNESYVKYAALANKASFGRPVETNTLQYYINLIPTKPYSADEALQQFKHPLAKAYRAYMYLSGDVPNQKAQVNALMNEALSMVFSNFKGQSRYDFSQKYAYEDLDQFIHHLRALHEAVKDEPDFPCWLFQRHPETCKSAFAPYWNNERDEYGISTDCGSFFDLPEMKILMSIAADFASTPGDYYKNSAALQHLYLKNKPLPADVAKALDAWNEKLWKSLEQWAAGSPLQAKLYRVLRFAYYDAARVLEDGFISKGFTDTDARSMSLQILKWSAGCSLDEYCGK